MKHRLIALAVAAMALGTAGQASAQSRSGDAGWWPWVGRTIQTAPRGKKAEKAAQAARGRAERSRNDDYDDRDARDDRDHDYGYGQEQRKGNGPPFCRNGQGHPVHGMQWCEQKGWAPASWQSVVYRSQLPSSDRIRQPTLRDILGAVVLGRLTSYSSQLGARGQLEGRSFYSGNASVLQLRAGNVPIAELTDLNRDGTVDLVLLAGR